MGLNGPARRRIAAAPINDPPDPPPLTCRVRRSEPGDTATMPILTFPDGNTRAYDEAVAPASRAYNEADASAQRAYNEARATAFADAWASIG